MESFNNSVSYCLTPVMRQRYYQTNDRNYNSFFFNGGEPHVHLSQNNELVKTSVEHVYIASRLRNAAEFLQLLVMVDACSRYYPNAEIVAYLPYIPGARQDRVYTGEALTVKVYVDMLNNSQIDRIITKDPHSDVQTALLETKLQVINGLDLADRVYDRISTDHGQDPLVIFPDTGAKKKYVNQLRVNTAISNGSLTRAKSNKPWYITGDKLRNTLTGKITGFKILDEYTFHSDEPVLLIDDICDGGGTFIGLGKELRKRGVVHLYLFVTHGIFSKGFSDLNTVFTRIYTTDSWQAKYDEEYEPRIL